MDKADAEVGNERAVLRTVEENVCWLDVAVDSVRVDVAERDGDCPSFLQGPNRVASMRPTLRLKRRGIAQHHVVGLRFLCGGPEMRVKNRHDRRAAVGESARRVDFLLKSACGGFSERLSRTERLQDADIRVNALFIPHQPDLRLTARRQRLRPNRAPPPTPQSTAARHVARWRRHTSRRVRGGSLGKSVSSVALGSQSVSPVCYGDTTARPLIAGAIRGRRNKFNQLYLQSQGDWIRTSDLLLPKQHAVSMRLPRSLQAPASRSSEQVTRTH